MMSGEQDQEPDACPCGVLRGENSAERKYDGDDGEGDTNNSPFLS